MLAATAALLLAAAPIQLHAQRSQLPNGLTVILAEDHQVPGVAVLMTYKVGSRDEAPGRTGFAHLFEHLMFMGSVHVPYPQFDTLQEAHGGQNNADTGNDHTRYYEWGPSNLLETFLWQEADRLATLPDAMTEEKVSRQRDVVLNERRESYENQPYGMAEVSVAEHVFPPGHPYHWPVIGYPKDLEAASKEDVVAFFRRFYTPTNAILTIVGDFKPEQAHAWIEQYFGWMPAHPADRAKGPPEPVLAQPASQELPDKVELPKAVLAWHSPASDTPGDAAAQLLAQVLAGSKASRLYRALVYEQRIAQDVSADQNSMKLGSIFEVDLLASPGHTAAEQIAAFDPVLASLAEKGPTQAELDAAKLDVRTSLARAAEPLVSRALLMERLEEAYSDPTAIDRELARYESQTVESVRDAARALRDQNHFTLTFKPSKEAESP
ncbi:MAG: insulinase family protein [Deltaproteobacteria bacterium]|nr:insulinase family protein [Deltaproteobacteria bacterium]